MRIVLAIRFLVLFGAGYGIGLALARAGGENTGSPSHPAAESSLRDFNPDRPSQFTGPYTVDPGHFQWEMDFANYILDRHNPQRAHVDVDQWNAAPFDLRIGLTSGTEVDFLYGGYLNLRTIDREARTDRPQSGFGDLTLLFKYNVFGDDSGALAFGILPHVKLPTNSAKLGNKRLEGGVAFPLAINLPANFQIGIETGFDAIRNNADTRFEPAFTNIAYLGYTFLNKKFTTYVEFFSRVNAGSDSEVDGELDTALSYFFAKNAEVDFGCNFGVTRAAADFHPFAGFSIRF